MNKVYHINLGGYPFTIDEDAYSKLTEYLASIEHHFSSSEDCEEIVQDIESRIAELLQEDANEHTIITLREVEHAISIMGTPEDFGDVEWEQEGASAAFEGGQRTRKRLYRNTSEKVVGGVCSGIAAYFGIHDPIWIRLLFVLITLSGGAGIPIYIVLWIVMPEPKTAADRLAMLGEPINVSNIAKVIEEGIDSISETITGLTEELGSKKKAEKERILVETPLPGGFLF